MAESIFMDMWIIVRLTPGTRLVYGTQPVATTLPTRDISRLVLEQLQGWLLEERQSLELLRQKRLEQQSPL